MFQSERNDLYIQALMLRTIYIGDGAGGAGARGNLVLEELDFTFDVEFEEGLSCCWRKYFRRV